jgi:hypothetical protein
MPEIQIDSLKVAIQNASGHEHRVVAIAGRAASIFSARLGRQFSQGATSRPRSIATIAPLQFDLRRMSDEQAANEIASAWFEAAILQLKSGR